MGCHLVILACNTASAKALRSIQINDLPGMDPARRVLGVIRPTVECIGSITQSRHVGVLATAGTIKSESYPLEIHKLFPDIQVAGEACPLWVSLVENNEAEGDGTDYFVRKYINELLAKDAQIDTVILGCTHYPLLLPKIKKHMPDGITTVAQGELVADSLKDYFSRQTFSPKYLLYLKKISCISAELFHVNMKVMHSICIIFVILNLLILTIMKSTDYSRTVEVFKGSPWEAELVKGLLENNGIATIIKDGLMSTIAPYIAPDVTILVSEERYEDAMEIIRERDKGKDEE